MGSEDLLQGFSKVLCRIDPTQWMLTAPSFQWLILLLLLVCVIVRLTTIMAVSGLQLAPAPFKLVIGTMAI